MDPASKRAANAPIPVPPNDQSAPPPQYLPIGVQSPDAQDSTPAELDAQDASPSASPQPANDEAVNASSVAPPPATAVAPQTSEPKGPDVVQTEEEGGRRDMITCQVPRKQFWVVLIVGVILVAAVIGGTIGGFIAGQKSRSGNGTANGNAAPVETAATVLRSSSTVVIDGQTTVVVNSITTTASRTSSLARATTSSAFTLKTGDPLPPSTTVSAIASVATCSLDQPKKLNDLSVMCPNSHNCIYAPPESSSRFHRKCGLTSAAIYKKLYEGVTKSMEECIAACIAYNDRNRAGACRVALWSYGSSGTCQTYEEPGVGERTADSVEIAYLVAY